MNANCETCTYLIYDEDYEEYVCDANMDEDDYVRVRESGYKACPFYRDADEYRIARKQ